jgi:hypothetical protein
MLDYTKMALLNAQKQPDGSERELWIDREGNFFFDGEPISREDAGKIKFDVTYMLVMADDAWVLDLLKMEVV